METTVKALLLVIELIRTKCVLVPSEIFTAVYEATRDLHICANGGAIAFDEHGEVCGQYLYID